MEKLSLHNTLTRSIEEFKPVDPNLVKLYACGPTVYGYAHIGNMRTYVFEDVLVRVLKKFGYAVNHVMNITDVGHLQSDADSGEDKMNVASKREKKSPWDIAKFYENEFFRQAELLNINKPNKIARATEHIGEIITMVGDLLSKGFAYESGGNIYFDVSKFPAYSEFARLDMNSQLATDRVVHDSRKKSQADFALWFSHSKFENQIMKWDSPWGVGFPGWHIECSAMAMKYLGEHIDIHCGGIDHIPVHHTNEIAQSECCIGHKWVNYWLHGAFLTVDEGKMSKSKGDVLTVDTIQSAGFHPLSYRYLILTSHYRKELKFSYDNLKSAQEAYSGLYEKTQEWQSETINIDELSGNQKLSASYSKQFWGAVANDLHTPAAISTVWAVVKDEVLTDGQKFSLMKEFDAVLGLKLSDPVLSLSDEEMEIINRRKIARHEKDWNQSDQLRDDLLEIHKIQVKDTTAGMSWVRVLPPIFGC